SRKRGECAKAIPHFEKAIALYDKYGDAFNEMGNCFKQEGRFEEAEDSFEKAIERNTSIYPSMNLADLYATRKRFDDAHRVIRQALENHPSEGDLYFAMARVYFDQGRMQEAEAAGLNAHSKVQI